MSHFTPSVNVFSSRRRAALFKLLGGSGEVTFDDKPECSSYSSDGLDSQSVCSNFQEKLLHKNDEKYSNSDEEKPRPAYFKPRQEPTLEAEESSLEDRMKSKIDLKYLKISRDEFYGSAEYLEAPQDYGKSRKTRKPKRKEISYKSFNSSAYQTSFDSNGIKNTPNTEESDLERWYDTNSKLTALTSSKYEYKWNIPAIQKPFHGNTKEANPDILAIRKYFSHYVSSESFCKEEEQNVEQPSPTVITYSRHDLMDLSTSFSALQPPSNWKYILEETPQICRQAFRPCNFGGKLYILV